MNKIRFLKYLVDNRYFIKYKLILTVLTPPVDSNELIEIKDNKVYGKIGDELFYLNDTDRPVFDVKDTIYLEKGFINIIKEDIVTTFGKFFLNYYLLELLAKDKGFSFDEDLTLSKYESDYLSKYVLSGDEKETKVDDILRYGKVADFLHNFAEFLVPSGSERLITAPDGIDEFKKELFKRMEKQYGKKWTKNLTYVAKAVEELIEFDRKYLEQDDTYGVLGSGKITNIIRVKQYLMMGAEISTFTEGEITTILDSLNDKPSMDPEIIAAKFNNARSGSYERGIATADAGVRAKNIASALSPYEISGVEDCKGSIFLELPGEYINQFNNRFMKGNKPITKDTKVIKFELRSLQTCKLKGERVCKKCAGTLASLNKGYLALAGLGLGGDGLNAKMKAMHGKSLSSIKLTIDDLLK